jgi:microcystin-dependent protein
MSQPFVGEIRMFAGNFAPQGWAFCNGLIMAISENDTLFQLIGTTYGGDGNTTFALPNLQGRVPLHQGSGGYVVGGNYGSATTTLLVSNLPPHIHPLTVSNAAGTTRTPTSAALADVGRAHAIYSGGGTAATLNPNTVVPAGGNISFSNVQPCQAVTFIISLFGIFPSQS